VTSAWTERNRRRFPTQRDLRWPLSWCLPWWSHASQTAGLKHTVREVWDHMHVKHVHKKLSRYLVS